MGWGQNAPSLACGSARGIAGFKARYLATAGLGFLLVFCLPGHISKADYTSAKTLKIADVMPAAPQVISEPEILAGAYLPPKNNAATQPAIPSKKVENTARKPVQIASLDLNPPKIEKPRDYVVPPSVKIMPQRPRNPYQNSTRPRLEKKLFGTVELRFDDERKIKAWSSVYAKFLADTRTMKACMNNTNACADPAVSQWAAKLKPLKNRSTFEKITAVNAMANQRIYTDDRRNYGRSDYWAAPGEFLNRGGDCEDYALLKFASLIALGVDEGDLRVVVGRLSDGTPHAFLAAHVGKQEYILDNRQSQVYLTENRKDYVPKYSMNLSYRWSHVVPRSTTL